MDIRADTLLNSAFTGFTQAQKNGGGTEEFTQGGDMRREYPATPSEAFEQALEGAIYADHLAFAYKHNHIGSYPLDNRFPVNTFWDLGRSHGNATAIWLEQDIQSQPRMVGYFEFEGEMIDQILRKLKEWAIENNVHRGASTTCRTMATESCCGCLKGTLGRHGQTGLQSGHCRACSGDLGERTGCPQAVPASPMGCRGLQARTHTSEALPQGIR
jgi:hypothetical protein